MTYITKLVLVYFLAHVSGCATIIGGFSKEPIETNPRKRSWGNWMDDQTIETIATVNIQKTDPSFKNSRVKAISFNGTLLLIGQVPTAPMKAIASETAKTIYHVKQVYNELDVSPIITFLTQSNDSLLTIQVKAGFISSSDVIADRIEVNTENSTVYLMGLVTIEEAQAAVDIARNVHGVKKVVKVFEYPQTNSN
ncbi:MAG: BON domain-containing protein [Candidatus Endonucleobacter bathymodioli]|uniref:BON domain-containing protein n=1 Tax=Candidatus Endonucleibacter bathymodioli TaxID=539814 RepID=A0AA90SCD6_9GAMM|nr:BON domain-containing protein [Candidatus Endonucleobacter bathymodioli]